MKKPRTTTGERGTILFVAGHPLDVGGVETYLLSLSKLLGRRFKVFLAASASGRFHSRAARAGLGVVPWATGFPNDSSASQNLRSLLEACRADIVHVQDLPSALTAGRAARRAGLPVVRTVHLPAAVTASGPGLRAWLRRGYYAALERHAHHRLADRVIFVAHSAMVGALSSGAVPRRAARFVPNGVPPLRRSVDAAARRKTRAGLGADPSTTVLCFVGRLDRQKGVDVLIDGLSRLGPQEHLQTWLLGDGPDRSALEALASQTGSENVVRFLGHREEVRRLLHAADAFVLPSRYEGMPIALLEAMAAGLPCLVSDVGDCGLLVREAHCGLVVPGPHPAAWADALRSLLSQPDRWRPWGEAARRAAAGYDIRQTVEATAAVYESVKAR